MEESINHAGESLIKPVDVLGLSRVCSHPCLRVGSVADDRWLRQSDGRFVRRPIKVQR